MSAVSHKDVVKKSPYITAELAYSGEADRFENGYQTKNHDDLWARPHIKENILQAAADLKSQGLFIPIGDLNRKPRKGDNPFNVHTSGHNRHHQGRQGDFYLIGPDRKYHRGCTVDDIFNTVIITAIQCQGD
jgi:hypothetical protein